MLRGYQAELDCIPGRRVREMVSITNLVVVLGLAVLSGSIVQARFVIEQGGLKISFPKAAAKAHPKGFDMSLANFGAPKYGGSLM